MLKRIFSIIFCFIVTSAFSQNKNITALSIGDNVPDVLLKNVTNYNSSTIRLSSFKGKVIILDFWSTYCSTCMAAFSKMEKLQRQYEGKLEVILVNSFEDQQNISSRLLQINKTRTKEGLHPIEMPKLTGLSGDSTLRKLFPHQSMPHHVWISEEGKVLAITNGSYANSENVRQVLEGKKVRFSYKDDFIDFSMKRDGLFKPMISSFNPVFYSGFMPYRELSNGSSGVFKDSSKGLVRMYRPNNSIFSLYQEAFKVMRKYPRVLFEVKNWGAFKSPGIDVTDTWLEKNMFSYELCVPEKEESQMGIFMQQDLNRFFGGLYGIEGTIEKRKIKSFVLIQTKEGLLKTNGEKSNYRNSDGLKVYTNYTFGDFSNSLKESLEDMTRPIAFIDETGFTGNVDIQFKGDMRSLQNVRNQLQQYGLDIIESEREIEVLVIKDKKKRE
ncbi:MAG: TlpA disulfide reductase family protein [Bacteroidota bacterium]